MILEDLLIMEVPRKALQHITSTNKLKPGGTAVEDYAKAIVSNSETIPIGQELLEDYRYAGQTAVSIYQPLSGLPKDFNNKESMKRFLLQKYGEELFRDGIRPDLKENPQLYKIEEFEHKWVLSLTYLGKEVRVLRSFELRKERPQYVDFMVLHFNPLLVEMRVPASKIVNFRNALLNVLNIVDNLEEVEWLNLSQLTDREAKELKELLDGGVIGAKHKMTEGIYDTIEVKAIEDIDDLFEEEEYQQSFFGKPFKSITFKFPFRHKYGLEESLSLRITPTGVSFYSSVSEEVIEYVITKIIDIKHKTAIQIAAAKEAIAK